MRHLNTLLSVPLALLLACNGSVTPSTAMTEQTPTGAAPPLDPGAPGPLTCDPADMLKCRIDADCACGSNLATGACAVGTAACIDTTKQCPDYCTGIDGRMSVRCQTGQCIQVHQ